MFNRRRTLSRIVLGCLVLGGCAAPGERPSPREDGLGAAAVTADRVADRVADGEAAEGHSTLHTVLLYLPDRLFDLMDVVRLRLRVGPGVAAGIRVTEYADAFAGTYGAIFVGIPGPRGEPAINWPFGLESKSGVEASVADATTDLGADPGYGTLEIGVSLHAVILGVDVGLDPWEAVDFLAGILTFDPATDDL